MFAQLNFGRPCQESNLENPLIRSQMPYPLDHRARPCHFDKHFTLKNLHFVSRGNVRYKLVPCLCHLTNSAYYCHENDYICGNVRRASAKVNNLDICPYTCGADANKVNRVKNNDGIFLRLLRVNIR